MFETKAPAYLWKEAINHGIWIGNRTMTHVLGCAKTPHEMATGEKPNMTGVSDIWVKVKQEGKLAMKAKKGMFVGINDESIGYRVYWKGKRRVTVE